MAPDPLRLLARLAALAGGWEDWRARGEELCARVYGERYPRLRARMRELHPALDEWMVVEGYGKTLSRPGLSPAAREICAVAALAARGAARQLEAHLRGATAVGLEPALACAAAREAALRHAPQDRRAELEACLRRADGTRA
ncbi:MAG: carboxymuconolactone decarboxylase family protein [Gemmatimonadota bacterium]